MLHRLFIAAVLVAHATGAAADTLVLANGDKINGEILEWAVDHVVIDHPQLGEIKLSLEQLDIDTGEPPNPGLFGTRFLRGWKRNVDFGWNGRIDESTLTNITAGLDFRYADEFKRWSLRGRYFFNDDEGSDDDDHNARLDLRRDVLFPGHRWFTFGAITYQYDEFESWQHRTIVSIGPGYNLVDGEAHSLDGRIGLAFTREFGDSQSQEGETLFALDYEWDISEGHRLTFSNELYVEYKPTAGAIRNLTRGEWNLRLTERPALSLKIGAVNEYESDVAPGDTQNDLRYYLALGADF